MYPYSNLLFAQPSFLDGFVRIVNFGDLASTYNASPSPEMADFLALRSDWCAVGEDLRSAMGQAEAELRHR